MKINLILAGVGLVLIGGVAGYIITGNDRHEEYDMHDSMHEHMEDGERFENKDLMASDDMEHMDHSMMTVSSEQDFLEGMIPHHQEAVDTAKEVLARGGSTTEIKALAEQIIMAQEKEITDMKAWYLAWYGKDYVSDNSYQPMMRDLSALSGASLDRRFLEDMTMHHMGAIMMAESVETHIEHQEVKDLADAIGKTQSAEIELMRDLLTKI